MAITLICATISTSSASIVYEIESLDDLIDAYYQGRVSYDIFEVLYNAYNLGGLSIDDLAALYFVDRAELNFLALRADTSDFWGRILSSRGGQMGVRRYSRNFNHIYTDYFLGFAAAPVEADLDIREERGNYSFQKRSASMSIGQVEITLGNYLAHEGYGLAIGRFDYRPSTSLNEDKSIDFWLPVNNYYNGLKAVIHKDDFSGRLYYSRKNYDENDKSFTGLGAGVRSEPFIINFMAGYNTFKSDFGRDRRLSLGAAINYAGKGFTSGGEYAVVGKSGGVYMKASKSFNDNRIESEFWRYAGQFKNYNCSAPAAADYETFFPAEDSIGFRSAQAGETGASLSYYTANLSGGVQVWHESRDQNFNSVLFLRYKRNITGQYDAYFQSSYRKSKNSEYHWAKIFIDTELWALDRAGFKYYASGDKLDKSRSYVFSDLRIDMNENLQMFFKIRSYFDGDVYWHIEENLETVFNLNIRTEVSYSKYTRINFKIEKAL